MTTGQRPLKTDRNRHPIQSGLGIADVLEVSITAASFVAVTLPAGVYSKSLYLTTRDGAGFLLSDAGVQYATIHSGFGIDLAADAGTTVFYVKGTSTTTLEVIVLG